MIKPITFCRNVRVILIPDGEPYTVVEGCVGYITQVLGGNWTVQLNDGRLVRVRGMDGDAIGEESLSPWTAADDGDADEEGIWTRLRCIFDPEIPVNIVELGLVYGLDLEEWTEGKAVVVTMTLTAPGCGMGQVLADDVRDAVCALPGVCRVNVDLVFEPPWTPERMTEAARLELGF